MEFARKNLRSAVISQEATDQVREVSETYSLSNPTDNPYGAYDTHAARLLEATLAVIDWAISSYNPTDIERVVTIVAHESEDVVVRLGSETWLINVLKAGDRAMLSSQMQKVASAPAAISANYRTIAIVFPRDGLKDAFVPLRGIRQVARELGGRYPLLSGFSTIKQFVLLEVTGPYPRSLNKPFIDESVKHEKGI